MKAFVTTLFGLSFAAGSAQEQALNYQENQVVPGAAAHALQSSLTGRTASTPSAWTLVWSDEFDSTVINTSNWTYDIGGGGWGNNELENYTNRPANATVQNGALLIIAKAESYGGNNYTSARLKSQNLRTFAYGRVEARIKLPAGQGLWPAFWMLGNNIAQVGWPKCGEIDIMEHINTGASIYGTMHWDNNGHVSSGGSTACDVRQYHIYSIEWDTASIRWLLDGSQYFAGNIANNINSTDEFHLPFFILLNMAVGGSWPGNPDGTTIFPDTMFVDYVRVYQMSLTGVRQGAHENPDRFALHQNYPNPFNPTTTIRYALPARAYVSLSVINTLGQQVAALVNGEQVPGYHEVKFDGSGHASGVYFYRLRAGEYVDTKRLLLLR